MSLTYEQKEQKWNKLYYGSLVGLKCVGVDARSDETGCWPVLIFDIGGGETAELEVSRDEEGNGPGFIFGLPMVPDIDNPFLKEN